MTETIPVPNALRTYRFTDDWYHWFPQSEQLLLKLSVHRRLSTFHKFATNSSDFNLLHTLPNELVNEVEKFMIYECCQANQDRFISFGQSDQDVLPIVMDVGTRILKCGFGGYLAPSSLIPTAVARTSQAASQCDMPGSSGGDSAVWVGAEAQSKLGVANIKHPIERGVVVNWDDMECVWHHAFYSFLKVAPEEHPVMLTQVPFNPKANKEKLTQIMFETFNTPAIYVQMPSVIASHVVALAAGTQTALFVDLGASVTTVTPIVEGFYVDNATRRIDLGCDDIAAYMGRLLSGAMEFVEGANILLDNGRSLQKWREITEKVCFVKMPDSSSTTAAVAQTYTFHDGKTVTVSEECHMCTEIMFSPFLIGLELPGIQQLIFESANVCEIDARAKLFDNIVIFGGGAKIPNMKQRILYEVQCLLQQHDHERQTRSGSATACTSTMRPSSQHERLSSSSSLYQQHMAKTTGISNCNNNSSSGASNNTYRHICTNLVRIHGLEWWKDDKPPLLPPGRARSSVTANLVDVGDICDPQYLAWTGGSYLCRLSTFQQLWTSKEEYDESGPSITCRRRCW